MAGDQMGTSRDPKARIDIGALDQRVIGLEKALSDITSAIAALGAKIDERSRTPWVTLISAFTFMLAFIAAIGVLAYKPIESDLARHERTLEKMQDRYVDDLRRQIEMLQKAK